MKEIEQLPQDKVQIVNQKEIEKKLIYIGSTRIRKGHTLFEINHKEMTIEKAEYISEGVIGADKKAHKKKKVNVKPNCIYIGALNKDNAVKKFFNELKKVSNGTGN